MKSLYLIICYIGSNSSFSVEITLTLTQCPAGMVYTNNTCHCLLVRADSPTLAFGQMNITDSQGNFLTCEVNVTNTTPSIIEYIILPISILGSLLIIITHLLFKEMRTLPSSLLVNLAFALLISDTLRFIFILTLVIYTEVPVVFCEVLYTFYFFFIFARFFWMNMMGIELVRTFRSILSLQIDTGKKYKSFIFYMSFGWGIPLAVSVLIIILKNTVSKEELSCTETNTIEYIILVITIILSILFSIILFIVVGVLFCRVSCRSNIKKSNNKKLCDQFRLLIAVFLSLGLVGIIGYIIYFISNVIQSSMGVDASMWIGRDILNIFQDSQSILLSIAFLCTRKVLRLYWSLFTCKGKRDREEQKNRLQKYSTTMSIQY